MHWRRKWQPTSVLLLGESQGRGSLVASHLWGRIESDTTEATQQQQQQQHSTSQFGGATGASGYLVSQYRSIIFILETEGIISIFTDRKNREVIQLDEELIFKTSPVSLQPLLEFVDLH